MTKVYKLKMRPKWTSGVKKISSRLWKSVTTTVRCRRRRWTTSLPGRTRCWSSMCSVRTWKAARRRANCSWWTWRVVSASGRRRCRGSRWLRPSRSTSHSRRWGRSSRRSRSPRRGRTSCPSATASWPGCCSRVWAATARLPSSSRSVPPASTTLRHYPPSGSAGVQNRSRTPLLKTLNFQSLNYNAKLKN